MSTDAMTGIEPAANIVPGAGLSPPDSTNAQKDEGSDSELSDLDDPTEELVAEPSYYDGTVPVFEPSMEDFKDFQRYMNAINKYGMKTGIVKIRPPQEWKDDLPKYDQLVKPIKLRDAIKQDIMGTAGTYRQANIVSMRSYNLPQWRALCEQSDHQPPAKRGERRANQDKPKPRPAAKPKTATKPAGRRKSKRTADSSADVEDGENRLPTPDSPNAEESDSGRKGPATSVSARRLYNRKEAATRIDEEAFKDFDYELHEEFSRERCEELERAYWKTLTYASPLYGADMVGTLFDERTKNWNLSNLPNLLDAMGHKIPGVNTAYLYMGMWKATFAWHLEDVDLYSINYLHFGAPKQWYSISQGDARKFEAAMKNIWPADAKACDQFLRHKTFLISPSTLLNQHGIKVNKIVHHPGEFVVTFPYGYHSGYNLGYNCAEAVNFALDSWLDFGRIAKRCDCDQAQDSVWIDVRALERKINGEPTDDELSEEDSEEDEDITDLPSPPDSNGEVKPKIKTNKRKRPSRAKEAGEGAAKKFKIRLSNPRKEPCALCPYEVAGEPLLPTIEGKRVHKICALYIPETEIEFDGEKDVVIGMDKIQKARLGLECKFCKSKKGACFQCSQGKCTRSYHAVCAAAAGVWVEDGETPVYGEDGTEYKTQTIEFSCRFHREKRSKKMDTNTMENDTQIRKAASKLAIGETAQFQYLGSSQYFAGTVVENNRSDETLVIKILPKCDDLVEVEYKYLRLPEPADFRMVKPSAKAIPLPKASLTTSKRLAEDQPRKDDIFTPGYTWKEFESFNVPRNVSQVKIDLNKADQMWHYLGNSSTEAKAQYTDDVSKPYNNPRAHFLDSIPKPIYYPPPRPSLSASFPQNKTNQNALNAARAASRQTFNLSSAQKQEKPYNYKPRDNTGHNTDQKPYNVQPHIVPGQQYPHPPSQTFNNNRYISQYARPADSRTASGYYQSSVPLQPSHSVVRQPQSSSFSPFGNGSKSRLAASLPVTKHVAELMRKYPYLSMERNYSSTTYLSPYTCPGPGFMNGYQGDLVAHLKASKPPQKESPPILPPNKYQHTRSEPTWQPSTLNRQAWDQKSYGGLHAAIRPEYHARYESAAKQDGRHPLLKNVIRQGDSPAAPYPGMGSLAPTTSKQMVASSVQGGRYYPPILPPKYANGQDPSLPQTSPLVQDLHATAVQQSYSSQSPSTKPNPAWSAPLYPSSHSANKYSTPLKSAHSIPPAPPSHLQAGWVAPSQRPHNMTAFAQAYQSSQPGIAQQEYKPSVHHHQQYDPKPYTSQAPSASPNAQYPQPQQHVQTHTSHAFSQPQRTLKPTDDILDLPPDSFGMVENIVKNTKRIATSRERSEA